METIENSPAKYDLKQRAEKKLKETTKCSDNLSGLSPKKLEILIRELQVHQIELEMQNNELYRIQGELEKTLERYSHLYDFAPNGNFSTDEDGIIYEANLTLASMLKIERSSLIGKPFSRFVMKDDQDIFYLSFRCLIETGNPQSCELQLVKKDENELNVRIQIMALNSRGNAVKQIRAAVSDITDRKLAEKKIKDYSEKLEKQVDLLQRMEAIGTFAGGIVHDFTNLLTVIISYSSFALSGVEPKSPVRDDIEKIILNAKHGLSLTHWLLLFNRNQTLEQKIVNVNELIIDMEKMLQRVITKNIALRMSLQPDIGGVLFNPAQIELIIINLVVNAVDAMPEGGLLTITTAIETSDDVSGKNAKSGHIGPKMVLSVSDTGIGMDKETITKIFKPFFTTKKRGTGLGLAIVFDAVEKYGGYIRVSSRPGQGSTLKVYLPRLPAK